MAWPDFKFQAPQAAREGFGHVDSCIPSRTFYGIYCRRFAPSRHIGACFLEWRNSVSSSLRTTIGSTLNLDSRFLRRRSHPSVQSRSSNPGLSTYLYSRVASHSQPDPTGSPALRTPPYSLLLSLERPMDDTRRGRHAQNHCCLASKFSGCLCLLLLPPCFGHGRRAESFSPARVPHGVDQPVRRRVWFAGFGIPKRTLTPIGRVGILPPCIAPPCTPTWPKHTHASQSHLRQKRKNESPAIVRYVYTVSRKRKVVQIIRGEARDTKEARSCFCLVRPGFFPCFLLCFLLSLPCPLQCLMTPVHDSCATRCETNHAQRTEETKENHGHSRVL